MRDDSFKDYVLDQLQTLGTVRARAMFGGHGLYRGQAFFGILHQGRLYFRTDDHTRPDYCARGMQPFQPNARQTLASYYEVPADVLDDPDLLAVWARAALSVQAQPKRGKQRPPVFYKPRAVLYNPRSHGRVAQLVEHATENRSVGSSILPPATIFPAARAVWI